MKSYKKLKQKSKVAHIMIVAIAIVMFWWGIWGLLDKLIFPNNPEIGYILSILVAIVVLYLDDFHLTELHR